MLIKLLNSGVILSCSHEGVSERIVTTFKRDETFPGQLCKIIMKLIQNVLHCLREQNKQRITHILVNLTLEPFFQ